MVRELIRREFRISLSAVSVGRLLRTLGLSPQRPLWRAWQADPDAVARWKNEEFPAIRKQAKTEGHRFLASGRPPVRRGLRRPASEIRLRGCVARRGRRTG